MYQDEMRCKKCEDANDPAKLRSEIEALRKQNAKNEDDAARYRWLREKGGAVWHIVDDPKNPKRATGAYYDAAVDDAMKTPNVE